MPFFSSEGLSYVYLFLSELTCAEERESLLGWWDPIKLIIHHQGTVRWSSRTSLYHRCPHGQPAGRVGPGLPSEHDERTMERVALCEMLTDATIG
jgi:hypothetical protein